MYFGFATPCTAISNPRRQDSRLAVSTTSSRNSRRRFASTRQAGSILGGVHLELTGENVTECVGGARGLKEADLARAYKSQVDPRLNYEQAMEIALRIAGQLNNH